jgi:hypothetical protein
MSNLRYVWSRNMQLRVAAPLASDWRLLEAPGHTDGLLAAIKCLHGDPPQVLALNAFAYRVPDDRRTTVAELCAYDWEERWLAAAFDSITSLEVKRVDHPGVPNGACDMLIDGVGRDGRPLRVRERHVPVAGQLLVVSAAGAPREHELHASVVDSWLVGASLAA